MARRLARGELLPLRAPGVPELADRVLDLLAGHGGCIGLVVEHSRDRRHRNAGLACDVPDGVVPRHRVAFFPRSGRVTSGACYARRVLVQVPVLVTNVVPTGKRCQDDLPRGEGAPTEGERSHALHPEVRSDAFRRRRSTAIIGDSQVSTAHLSIGVLELEDGDGHVGTGFFHTRHGPAALAVGAAQHGSQRELAEQVIGASPFAWVNRLERPRGGRIEDIGLLPERRAGDVGPPGPDPRPAAVQAARRRVGNECRPTRVVSSSISPTSRSSPSTPRARAAGFSTFKVKVGHPDLAWDIRRLRLVQEAVGASAC